MKKLLSLLTMFSIFIGGLAIADYAYIEDPDGKIHTVEMTMLSDGKFIIKMEDVSPFWITFLKSGMSHQVSNSYNFNYSSKSTDEVSIQFVYKSKRMGAKFRYNFKTGEFVYNYAKLGETANSNYNPDDYEDNNPEENTENNGTENNNTENNDTENNDTENNNTENNNTENNDTENNNTGNNDETQDTYDDSTQNSSNNDKTETVKKNTTLNLTTNDKSPEIKQYINLTIETDENYTGKLSLSAKYKSSSSSNWSSISNTSSTYFSDYSDDWDNGYYKMKSSDYGEVTLKNLIKFKKGGSYRIYVKDTDGNEEYIQFTVSEPEDDEDENENKTKTTNESKTNENKVGKNNKYENVTDYHNSIINIGNNCFITFDNIDNEFYSGTFIGLRNAVNTSIKTCKETSDELENDNGREGDKTLRNAINSLVKKDIEYLEKYLEFISLLEKGLELTDDEQKLYNSVISELNSIGTSIEELQKTVNEEIESFAKKWGYELLTGCSIDGSQYSYEQNLAYQRACMNGITTIQDINSAGLDQPLTRAQLAKMMSMFEYSVLGKLPQSKGKAYFKDVSSNLGDLEDFIQAAYEYGIMGVDSNGSPIQYFNPHGTLKRGDFATVFSRVLWGNKYNNNGKNYYSNHLNALKNAGYLTNIDHSLTEVRGYVMLMMYRAAKQIYTDLENQALTQTTTVSESTKTTNSTKSTNSNNTSSSSSTKNQALENEYAAIAARGNAAGASAGAIRAQQNEAYNRAVAGNTVDTSKCGSYNPYGGESYGGWLNRCQNGGSITDTYKINTNSNDKMYEALSNYIKSSNGLSTSSNSLYNKDQYDYLNDFVGALNASTNTYTPKINLGQNKKDYSVNRAINAINSARGGYSPTINLSIGKDINRNIKF